MSEDNHNHESAEMVRKLLLICHDQINHDIDMKLIWDSLFMLSYNLDSMFQY